MTTFSSSRILAALAAATTAVALGGALTVPGAAARESVNLRGIALAAVGPPATGVPGPDGPGSFDATLPNGRRVTPAGVSVQVGQNPLNSVLTDDGRFLVTTNDTERGIPQTTGSAVDPLDTKNGADTALSQYSIAVTDTATMRVVAAVKVPVNATPHPGSTANGATGRDKVSGLFLGLATTRTAAGYRVYASGGVADVVYQLDLATDGEPVGTPAQIPVPVPQDKTRASYGMAMPGWLTLSDDKSTLYVVNDNGNSVVPVDLGSRTSGTPMRVGYFPYAAQVYGDKLFVSNWGLTDRVFADGGGTTDPVTGVVSHSGTPFVGGGAGNLFANPVTDRDRSSSVSVIDLPTGQVTSTISLARPIDGVDVVGGTHPSALAVVANRAGTALYVAASNEDRIAVIDPQRGAVVARVALSSADAAPGLSGRASLGPRPPFLGLVPNALAVSPDQRTLYVAEAGLNCVAVYDVRRPYAPRFRGLIPTGWYPTGVTVSPDGAALYVTNAKGAGSPYRYRASLTPGSNPPEFKNADPNWQFGSVQKVPVDALRLADTTRRVLANTVALRRLGAADVHKLNVLARRIKHVVFVLRENKTYDTYLGDDTVLNARGADGEPSLAQYGPYVPAIKALAERFAVGDNNHADAEESNAGHAFALAGQSTDFQQKTMLVRQPRPLVDIKNQDPEDYPLQGYIFNAMARAGRSFRDYGDAIRVSGYNDAGSTNYCANDPKAGCDNATYDGILDTTSPTAGLGGLYSETVPALQVLGGHIDERYPGWNIRISDQRRVKEFIRDFDPLIASGQAPAFTHIWLPVDHTGPCSTNAVRTCPATLQVRDGDEALGQLMSYLSHSAIWKSTAVFIAPDDAQGSPDHVYAHRSYTVVASPWARRGAVVHRLGSTVSIPKTIEEILGLPPMSHSDLVAADLLDYFTTEPDATPFDWPPTTGAARSEAERLAHAPVPAPAARIWRLADRLDTSTYDADTGRIGALTALYLESLRLARRSSVVDPTAYERRQAALYRRARAVVAESSGTSGPADERDR